MKSWHAWLIVVLSVIVFDIFAEETMSTGFERALKKHRILLTVLWFIFTAHILRLVPKDKDVLHIMMLKLRERVHDDMPVLLSHGARIQNKAG